MNPTLLLIAYHYPPENTIGAARPARFVKYLPGLGWNCQVITAAPRQSEDSLLVCGLEDKTRDLWEGDAAGESRVSVLQRYSELAMRRFLFRGALGLTWAKGIPAVAEGLSEGMPTRPAAVFSTFPPLSSHLAGWRTARRLRVPWIADFRDPFAPAISREGNWLPRLASETLEKRFFREAASIIVNTEAMAAMYRERYPEQAAKISVIWNGFDPHNELGPLPIPPRQKRILSHVGTLYAGRNPVAILESMERLRARGDAEALNCEIVLIGPNFSNPDEQTVIDRCVAAGWTKQDGTKIPQEQALRITRESDGLLLLQPQSEIQVPGKLFEYVRIGRPILSLAPRNSPIEWILGKSGIPHTNLYPNDPGPEVDRKISEYLRASWTPTSPSEWFQNSFDAIHQCRQLVEILDATTRHNGAR